MTRRSILGSGVIICAALAMPMFQTGVAFARKDCHARIQQEQQKLDRAVQKHGEHSRQAEKERRRIANLRQACH
jgi:hypothetical protein